MTAEPLIGDPGEKIEPDFHFPRWLWSLYVLMLTAIALVGATSFWMEAGRDGDDPSFWPFAVDEATSVVAVLALTPLLLAWAKRLAPSRIGWALTLLGHAAGLIVFILLHVVLMLLLRFLSYPLFGGVYGLDNEPFLTRLIYEGRKDSLTYVGLVIGAWLLATLFARRANATPAPQAEAPSRLEIRDGAKRLWLATHDIQWVEAAGNYVELHLADRSLLRRQTLAALERDLAGQDFVRIHRSRLVNARHVVGAETNESGDFSITLKDGRRLSGSRRWRGGLNRLALR
ncbi:LytTR family transcriptional regulator [Nordella sp. HKS 07]|uniref:LytTR family DNA-binding domain-containing protein n=1 Tax=Nordella sp. HKS 07 TaxID=2712222 RepID=UPI0013E1BE82|nr:LytTR family DNA-binding domain-containing protein [Nordella sp. HKS 07]QIG50524.1 LytTR family transcriptional regulator [Nordella sp. HKS 07]